jgi:hypothetical protein
MCVHWPVVHGISQTGADLSYTGAGTSVLALYRCRPLCPSSRKSASTSVHRVKTEPHQRVLASEPIRSRRCVHTMNCRAVLIERQRHQTKTICSATLRPNALTLAMYDVDTKTKAKRRRGRVDQSLAAAAGAGASTCTTTSPVIICMASPSRKVTGGCSNSSPRIILVRSCTFPSIAGPISASPFSALACASGRLWSMSSTETPADSSHHRTHSAETCQVHTV